MKANLYLHPDAFAYNGTDTEAEVTAKLNKLAEDMRDVLYRKTKDNAFVSHSKLPKCKVFQDIDIMKYIREHIRHEAVDVLFSIVCNTSDDFNEDLDSLRARCKYSPDEEEVNAVLAMNQLPSTEAEEPDDAEVSEQEGEEEKGEKVEPVGISYYMQFDNYEIVYNKSSWITLRRQILGNHPGEPGEFIAECKKYFPKIEFHDNCVNSLSGDDYLTSIPRKIVYYLAALNDQFSSIRNRHAKEANAANAILADFSGAYRFDKAGSLQGNPKTKKYRKFLFTLKDGETIQQKEMECEPHLKIERPDKNYTGSRKENFHPRIYFHFGAPDVCHGKILVGSIGPHL